MDYTALVISVFGTGVTVGLATVGGLVMLYQRLSRVEEGVKELTGEMDREHGENRQEHRDLFSKVNQVEEDLRELNGYLRGKGIVNGESS